MNKKGAVSQLLFHAKKQYRFGDSNSFLINGLNQIILLINRLAIHY